MLDFALDRDVNISNGDANSSKDSIVLKGIDTADNDKAYYFVFKKSNMKNYPDNDFGYDNDGFNHVYVELQRVSAGAGAEGKYATACDFVDTEITVTNFEIVVGNIYDVAGLQTVKAETTNDAGKVEFDAALEGSKFELNIDTKTTKFAGKTVDGADGADGAEDVATKDGHPFFKVTPPNGANQVDTVNSDDSLTMKAS